MRAIATLLLLAGSVSAFAQDHTVTDTWPGCRNKADFEKVADYMIAGDNEAAGQVVLSHPCVLLRRGEKVYRTEVSFLSGAAKIRRRGETVEYWTFIEAIR